MPSRIIKETIIISESLTAISAEAERFFWRLVVKADDFGLYYGDPRILASLCFPQKPPSEQKIRSWLNELVREDMVGTYTAPEDGKKYLKLLNWGKCQQTRAKSSKYPEPSSFDSKCKQANGNQMLANVPVNVNENGNGNDNENEKRAHSGRGAADGFDRFWASYPRRVGKKDAVAVWKKISPDDALVDRIVAGVERWKRSEQWTKDEGRFIPYAKPLEYGFRGHFVPGHWDGKSFVYQPKDPQGGMFVHSLIPGHYTLERAVNATKRTQNARLQRRFEQELKKRGYMKYFK